MELQQRSCVLPSNAPALPEQEPSVPSRVLQERSGNTRHGYADAASGWKRSASPAENLYSHRLGGSYFSGNLVAQPNSEKSEEQINYETRRLLQSLQRCEKYRKYRDRQPQNAKEREQKWPDSMEEAFFRALVRWPPMGRRKLMLDGQLRGRNELVAASIQEETGMPRSRKQVSSHIQVLKNFFIDQPQIAIYMSTEDMGGKRSRHAPSHLSHLRSRHGITSSRYDSPSQSGTGLWDGFSYLPSSHALAKLQTDGGDPAFTVVDFALWISDAHKQPTHYLSQLAKPSRHPDLNVTDRASWHKQYREFEFLQTSDWKERQMLVCDASLKIMTEAPPKAEFSTQFLLKSAHDLSLYETPQCRIRFYDSGKLALACGCWQGRNCTREEHQVPSYETVRECKWDPVNNHMLVPIGSNFWVGRTSHLSSDLRKARRCEDTSQRSKMGMEVRRSLQYLTAVQDIWGVRSDTGAEVCLVTILWRFHQSSSEGGKMRWRAVDFSNLQEQAWIKHEQHPDPKALTDMVPSTASASASNYPPRRRAFPHPPFSHPPQLDLESALEGMSDFSNPNSATAPSLATDYSQTHSLPSLTHSHDTHVSHHHQPPDFHDTNDLDFTGGHINICLEPAINLGAYEQHLQTPASSFNQLQHALASVDHGHDPSQSTSHGFEDLGLGLQMQSCYPTRPSWPYQELISRFEGIAEQSSQFDHVGSHGEDIAGHGVLHDGQLGHGMWRLQTGFGDDTGVGADPNSGRKDSVNAGLHDMNGHGQAILDLIERGRERPPF